MILPDLLDYNLDIIFCGMAASKKSKKVKAYYAGPGNKFWKILYQTGLTKEELSPHDFRDLLDSNIGLTDICKRDYGNDNELDASKYDRNGLNVKILKYNPKFVCFNGKNAAKVYLNKKNVDYGLQKERAGESKIFICPSTSGAANGFWNPDIWKDLKSFI